ncbi:ribosomal protein S18 [Helicocarpus griseus UAMH5409]|uniref:Small ribosomal subunit protein bS18m n=1 Tax=Helicocarpus griseus UAMH5409 TaxID=1447875 RepID=A0A2B7YCZ0_9EURO|nr:ribosomal protein S18 [Helicocarpus griseus UAMH5409]
MASKTSPISSQLRQLPRNPAVQGAQQRWNSTGSSLYSRFAERSQREAMMKQAMREKFEKEMLREQRAKAFEKQQKRFWENGDVYSPHDLSPAEMRKWRVKKSPPTDAFDALSLNPLHLYKNFAVMSEYMTEMGRIRHSSETGLRPVNQRKISKAIRRAIGLGLMPSVHKHPEVLASAARARMQRGLNP